MHVWYYFNKQWLELETQYRRRMLNSWSIVWLGIHYLIVARDFQAVLSLFRMQYLSDADGHEGSARSPRYIKDTTVQVVGPNDVRVMDEDISLRKDMSNQPTHLLALLNIRTHGPCSPHPSASSEGI